jgi:hypothetical protein
VVALVCETGIGAGWTVAVHDGCLEVTTAAPPLFAGGSPVLEASTMAVFYRNTTAAAEPALAALESAIAVGELVLPDGQWTITAALPNGLQSFRVDAAGARSALFAATSGGYLGHNASSADGTAIRGTPDGETEFLVNGSGAFPNVLQIVKYTSFTQARSQPHCPQRIPTDATSSTSTRSVGLGAGAIVGIVIGSFAVVGMIVIGVILC